MEIVVLQVFVSLMLVMGSLVLFCFACQQRDFDHADRLALLPIEDEDVESTGIRPDGIRYDETTEARHG